MRLHVAAFAAALTLIAATPPSPRDVASLSWMAGTWQTGSAENWTEESWSAPRAGMMIGTSRSARGGTLREFEFLRIVTRADGGVEYIAQPGGGAPVAFTLTAITPSSVTFENAAHDFPQRIAYRRSGRTMTATIAAIDGSGAVSWTYRRAAR